ncbi:MAG: hypothetical protein IPL78_04920 [Chloroflexi bacterium]|nr:hypothetical protein [Chloroflexota bacterium]
MRRSSRPRSTSNSPDFAIIYEDNFNYLSKMCLTRMREAAFTMIRLAHERGVPVILCGSDATDHAESYLHQGADYVLLGEGELTLVELLDHLSHRQPTSLNNILGLAYAHNGNSSQPVSQSATQLLSTQHSALTAPFAAPTSNR